ncbi:hypothetical protein DPMN_160111 [Dreissena polymorpha]|uniref:Uncharacterized protein n=1 Tax=Dreissena polymorpha TaxID=45954 RepID=A0A9D4EK78_DREPO|nr:hypothetical protein DPMN_160111 [Dreissena polymorpha]
MPSFRDVMEILKAFYSCIQCLEKSFENDMNCLWAVYKEMAKKVIERVWRLVVKVTRTNIHPADLAKRGQVLVKERDTLIDDVSHLSSAVYAK